MEKSRKSVFSLTRTIFSIKACKYIHCILQKNTKNHVNIIIIKVGGKLIILLEK